MPNRLTDIQVEEISGVDKAANRRRFLLMKREGGGEGAMDKADKPMKTEDGKQYPAEAYLYVPDPEKPSTWKLRIWEDPEKKVTAAQVGRAIAALSPGGFRGNQVDIPEDEIPKIKAKLRRLWREVNPDKDPDEMPETIKKQGFIAKIAETLKKAIYGKDFEANLIQSKIDEQWWRANEALRTAISEIIQDEGMTPQEKISQIAVTLGQFQEYILGLAQAQLNVTDQETQRSDIQKIGAKIARSRLEKIKAAYAVLAEILAEVEGDEEGDEMTKEEITRMVEDALKPVVERLEKLEKPEDGDKNDPAAEQVKKEDVQAMVTEAVNKALEPVLQRLEVVEKAKGIKKSVDGQDDPDKDVKKSIWAGIL
ncbi:MAG TPA: hypothetical protein GXX40_05650 [Firmicutes bacterium]|nr:hypothetical protein [Bacillota bacterium]